MASWTERTLLTLLTLQANQSSNETSNHSIGNRSLVAEILDLLSPATAQAIREVPGIVSDENTENSF